MMIFYFYRMQNDVKLLPQLRRKWVFQVLEQKRDLFCTPKSGHMQLWRLQLFPPPWLLSHLFLFHSYAHVLDGLIRVWKEGKMLGPAWGGAMHWPCSWISHLSGSKCAWGGWSLSGQGLIPFESFTASSPCVHQCDPHCVYLHRRTQEAFLWSHDGIQQRGHGDRGAGDGALTCVCVRQTRCILPSNITTCA